MRSSPEVSVTPALSGSHLDSSPMGFEAVRQTYAERDRLASEDWRANRYHPRHPLGRLFAAHNREVLTDALNACGIELGNLRVLDVGCGTGFWLRQLVDLGASPEHLTGTDLSPERIAVARAKNPAVSWIETEGELPFDGGSFDLVMQTVVFSSIHDGDLRRDLAAEMSRVAGSGGHILWLDLKPGASETLATFSRADVAGYFPDSTLRYERQVHPRYFRHLYGRPWFVTSLYRLTSALCEASLLVYQKH
jgi:ubiquinone/menaquinone biosynthesis C-methylase UbiE